jgi:hypothetical protein
MGQTGTVLSPILRGDFWRVLIKWPNGGVHHVGKFGTEREAIAWINRHPQLAVQVEQPREIQGRGRPTKNSVAVESSSKRRKAHKKTPPTECNAGGEG